MVVDVGIVKNHIKPKAHLTLYNMRKADLIEYIRTLEHNYNVAVSFNENQARYIESLGFTGVVQCKDCKHWQESVDGITKWCPLLMDKETKADDFCSYGERSATE